MTLARAARHALAPLLVAALVVMWLVLDAQERARLRTDAALRESIATSVTALSAQIRDQLSLAATSGTAGTTIPLALIGTSTVSASAAVEARDSGKPVVDDSAEPPSIVVPVYAGGQAPAATAERRAGISAYRVVPLALGAALTRITPSEGGLVVHGPSRVVVAEPGTAPAGSRTFTVALDLGGPMGWTVLGWLPTQSVPIGTWLLALAVLVVATGLAAFLTVSRRHADASRAREDQLERDGRLVSGLAPVVQASLDLGEVIPAATSHLALGLDLVGLSLSAPGEGGRERQLFSWGTPPDATVPPIASVPTGLDPGETFALSLARGGRVLGVLRVVAGAPLAATDLRALATASELIGSTLANAEAFEQQQLLLERMRSVDELKTVFLATASHELRTPVAAIVGFSTLVLQQWGSGDQEKAKSFLERVVANARGLETLTEQLLDFSRLERGIGPQLGELLELGRTTGLALAERPELTSGHKLDLHVAQHCLVRGSATAVERIVTNLVSNAAKYSPQGSTITVTVHTEGPRVVLVVDDEGPGVPEADRDRVFTRFYRGRGDEIAGTRGAGVGLAIVAEFAASMAGRASVHEAPSGGARFCVSFPAAGIPSQDRNEGAPHVRHA